MKIKSLLSSQLRLNMFSGAVSTGLSLIVAACKYPIYIHFLGYDQYGVWLLLSTVLVFAQMGLLGIRNSIIKLIAEEHGKNNHIAVRQYFTSAVGIVCIAGGTAVALCYFFRPQIINILSIDGQNAKSFSDLIVFMALFSTGVLAYQILNSVLAGIGRIDLANYSQTVLQVLPLVVSIPLLVIGEGVTSLLWANVFAYIIVFSLNFYRLYRITRYNIFSISDFSIQAIKRMLYFGINLFAGAMFGMMVLPITKILITRLIGIESVTTFELSYQVSMQIRSLFEAAFKALMPEFSQLSAQSDTRENITKICNHTTNAFRLVFFVSLPLYIVMFFAADQFFSLWLGDNLNESIPAIFRIMLLSSFAGLIGVIPYYLHVGLGILKNVFIHHILFSIVTTTLLFSSIHIFAHPTINLIPWCFVAGSCTSTFYLLLSQKKHLYLLSQNCGNGTTR